jgi:hypothetical protein
MESSTWANLNVYDRIILKVILKLKKKNYESVKWVHVLRVGTSDELL